MIRKKEKGGIFEGRLVVELCNYKEGNCEIGKGKMLFEDCKMIMLCGGQMKL